MRIPVIIFTLLLSIMSATSQTKTEKLPYYEIPEQQGAYTAGTAVSRMIDGLGFRYYWATEGLREEDLNYKASESGRTSAHTIDHIYGLSHFILSAVLEDNKKNKKNESLSFEEQRRRTLFKLKRASDILKETTDLSKFDTEKYPFWNIINGPIADALWHCGQIVMLRRASGNPFNSKVSVFRGTVKD